MGISVCMSLVLSVCMSLVVYVQRRMQTVVLLSMFSCSGVCDMSSGKDEALIVFVDDGCVCRSLLHMHGCPAWV